MMNIRYQVGSGEKILFWHDVWVGDRPLAAQFSDLYNCALVKEVKVQDYIGGFNQRGQVVWSTIFRRNLRENVENQLLCPFTLLNGVFILEGVCDARIWTVSKEGSFLVSFFFFFFAAL